ncbi:hypothetical protein [Lysinibacillus pakistanensis]|uniref:Uncharacterized protein n=1 Tax=Lysinibacillus pakistanensis TaxID=759811 RepID=A0AAX3WW47_9BACI|nr:hypothetical protein [Lysinibacillus pakistanensis]MDM5231483.1 hypothetical protein [Lysinibacillus pakistanensis]WHY47030.1 hypothetical protein QNH22_02080 [Lysinibacillus pakistanensis]WHY52041.1 hypothetical protein QNH24_02075 [Lysinibacillus pakistanensis]
MYKVINRFKEKYHDDHIYEVGDPYPADGKKLVKTRAEALTKVHEEYNVAFLKAVEEPKKASTRPVSKELPTDEESDE